MRDLAAPSDLLRRADAYPALGAQRPAVDGVSPEAESTLVGRR